MPPASLWRVTLRRFIGVPFAAVALRLTGVEGVGPVLAAFKAPLGSGLQLAKGKRPLG